MTAAPATNDAARLAALVDAVQASGPSVWRLLAELDRLDTARQPALAAALFERFAYRVDIRNGWLCFRMARIYAALGPERGEAAYFAAAMARQLDPDGPAGAHANHLMFDLLRRSGRTADAVALFRHRLEEAPQLPLAGRWELEPMLRELGEAMPDDDGRRPSAAGARDDHLIVPPETRPPWHCRVVDGEVPEGLAALATRPWHRPAVSVAELPDAEVLILDNTVVVVDRDGVLHPDLSVGFYPDALRRTHERMRAAGKPVAERTVDTAVVVSDYGAAPNLCHFLLDQFTRLALYERAGVTLGEAVVIGPEPNATFQSPLLRRAGVGDVLHTNQHCRVRARRLWVSSNFRDVRHFALWGAGWAIEFVQRTLGGRGTKGWRRLYVSRNDAERRRVVNEAEVMALLALHGFEMIVPGAMPYAAQVAAFKQASHVIAPHGAALAHMVLCPPGARVLELFHPLFADPAFAMQVQAADLDYTALIARDGESDAPEHNDPAIGAARHFFDACHMRVPPELLARYLATACPG